MIRWGDIYNVVEAMLPLYTAVGLGYGSVRWWNIFTPEQSDAINKFVSLFSLPLFNLEFMLHTDPFTMNYRFVAADIVAKAAMVLVLAAYCVGCGGKRSLTWSVTSFSLFTFTNCLVVGVPLLRAMYGPLGQDLAVQSFVVQALLWLTLFLLALEYEKARADSSTVAGHEPVTVRIEPPSEKAADGNQRIKPATEAGTHLETRLAGDGNQRIKPETEAGTHLETRPAFWPLMKVVVLKLSYNPNTYGGILGIAWAAVANRWHLKMPAIVEGSVLIMSKGGAGMAMFSMGLFMANQDKLIACGLRLTVFAMALRFIAAPIAMAIGSVSVGLRGDVLRIAVLQAALPQAVTAFIFAREYRLHADVLSTAVIFETLVSLPMLIVYYAILQFMH